MKKIEEHVRRLFHEVPDSDQKNQVMQEIISDLEEKVRDLRAQGKEEEDAVNKAIVEFGDIDDLKHELAGNKKSRKKKGSSLGLGYSIWGSALIIALVLFINFYYSPKVIWFVYPTFAVLWWPLSMFFRWLKRSREDDEDDETLR